MRRGAADQDLLDLVERFFRDHAEGHTGDHAGDHSGADLAVPATMWTALAELGLPWVGLDEGAGGSGGTLIDAVSVVAAAARHAVPVPIAETWLAAWLLAEAGQPIDGDPAAVATARSELAVVDGRVSGRLIDVPWLPAVGRVHGLAQQAGEPLLVSLDVTGLEVRCSADLAGRPLGSAELRALPATVVSTRATAAAFSRRAALLTAAQLAGAMSGVHELTWRYTNERVQFGKPIAAFQAVQQHLVTVAQCAAMSWSAVERAALALQDGDGAFEVAAAKLVVSENASECARAAHQAHGAIGMTREYPLQRLTRRLLQWREEAGGVRQLSAALGAAVAGAPSLSGLVAATRPNLEVEW